MGCTPNGWLVSGRALLSPSLTSGDWGEALPREEEGEEEASRGVYCRLGTHCAVHNHCPKNGKKAAAERVRLSPSHRLFELAGDTRDGNPGQRQNTPSFSRPTLEESFKTLSFGFIPKVKKPKFKSRNMRFILIVFPCARKICFVGINLVRNGVGNCWLQCVGEGEMGNSWRHKLTSSPAAASSSPLPPFLPNQSRDCGFSA